MTMITNMHSHIYLIPRQMLYTFYILQQILGVQPHVFYIKQEVNVSRLKQLVYYVVYFVIATFCSDWSPC